MKDMGRLLGFALGLVSGIAGTMLVHTVPQPVLANNDRHEDYIMATGTYTAGGPFANAPPIADPNYAGLNGLPTSAPGSNPPPNLPSVPPGGPTLPPPNSPNPTPSGPKLPFNFPGTKPAVSNPPAANPPSTIPPMGTGKPGGYKGGNLAGPQNPFYQTETLDTVWLLDYRAGKLLGTIVDGNIGRILKWAEVDLVQEFKIAPKQDVHFLMSTGSPIRGQTALYVAETTTGRFGVYSLGLFPDPRQGVIIRRHDATTFRTASRSQ